MKQYVIHLTKVIKTLKANTDSYTVVKKEKRKKREKEKRKGRNLALLIKTEFS